MWIRTAAHIRTFLGSGILPNYCNSGLRKWPSCLRFQERPIVSILLAGVMSHKEVSRMTDLDWQKVYFSLDKVSARAPCRDAEKESNMPRNRWHNVLPFDEHRVRLKDSGGGGSDYINASLVVESGSGHRYLATQGPLRETAADFWCMLWQQEVAVVVMLCKTHENCIEKCHQYWPDTEGAEGALKYPGRHLEIRLKEESDLGDYSKRVFSMRRIKDGEEDEREVQQFHFLAWPDFGVPETPRSVMSVITATREARGESGLKSPPMVVHCSAGIGRTGTFCLIDSFQTLMEEEEAKTGTVAVAPSLNDVCNALLRMRRYRRGLVQTHQQLRFSYLAVREIALRMQESQEQEKPVQEEENGVEEHHADEESSISSEPEDEGDESEQNSPEKEEGGPRKRKKSDSVQEEEVADDGPEEDSKSKRRRQSGEKE